jgi:mono/diheme cytochrome c family protein
MNMNYKLGILILCLLPLAGCQGMISEKPPIHPNVNLDFQPKFKAQSLPQTPPAHTVPWGTGAFNTAQSQRDAILQSDVAFYAGMTPHQSFVTQIPVDIDHDFINHGQTRFNIYCAACHDRTGAGQGMVVRRGFIPPPDLIEDRLLNMTDGELFDIITRGRRTMPSYAYQIPVLDRWAIVAYVRALQKARTTTAFELTTEQRMLLH